MGNINNSSASDNLTHAGIKGMKWGIRRYQNEDGSLTEAGRKRYAKAMTDDAKSRAKNAYDKAANIHLAKNPGDSVGARAAGEAAANAAAKTAAVDKSTVLKDAVKSDLDATQTILKEGGNAARTASSAVKNIKVKAPKMDLSDLTDQEMRNRIHRERLENEYDQMFNTERHRAERGKETVTAVLDGLAAAGGLAASALTIALMVKQLKT